ncbi:MAG TPA: hypothetical protein VNO21_04185 [Polyangiaceae bacterium]|nr:hypothetical protein [Polyangiaceae bacterium]
MRSRSPQRYGAIRPGVVTLAHGYDRLTSSAHCDPVARTPFHKFVPVAVTKL